MAARRLLTLVAAVALCAQLCAGSRKLQDDPTLYDASKMTKQQVKDALAYQQLFTGYAALNPVRPTLMEATSTEQLGLLTSSGHYEPVYLGANSSSKAAQTYIEYLQQLVSDGNKAPDYAHANKSTVFNESWALGLDWTGLCLQDANLTKPVCDFTFDFASRSLGQRAIPRVPAAIQCACPGPSQKGAQHRPQITFKSCGISMNNGITGDNDLNLALDVSQGQMNYSAITNSSTCFIDHDITHAHVYSAFQARSIQRLDFLTTFADASPDGPPGDYSVTYRCQYTYNQLDTNPTGNLIQLTGQVTIPFNALGNQVGTDPRITSWLPNLPNGGLFGPPGNGGNLGRK